MNKLQLLAAAALATSLPSAASADAFCTSTTPGRVITYNDGRVTLLAPWRGDYTDVCNMSSFWNGVSPATCTAWFATLSNAFATARGIGIYYAGIGQADCSALPTYTAAPVPTYVTAL